MSQSFIPSVNFHLWEPCNMRCAFCFATFQDVKQSILPKGHLPKEQAVALVQQLADFGFQKITFAGGEPTLCPWLPELIATAKKAGLTTMIVSNGSQLTDNFLAANRHHLDWIALSIDSLNPETNVAMGRAITGKKPLSAEYYHSLVEKVKQYGYGLKINTVVTRLNLHENISDFIRLAQPRRWKILQVLPIAGQNDGKVEALEISENEFLGFISRHQSVANCTSIVPETNAQVKGSYAMIDPAGRFFHNAAGKHIYSEPILAVGVINAIQTMRYDFDKFMDRGGLYEWEMTNKIPSRITFSGEVASGKSTIGKLLAQVLNYNFASIGDKTRAFAESKGMTIVEFQRICLQDKNLDKQIDNEFANECNSKENLIIDYRLGFKFIEKGYHILLKISETTALQRLKLANRINETHETVRERNHTFQQQFQQAYGVDYTQESQYNLVIEVEKFDSPQAIVEYILLHFNPKKNI